MSDVINVSSGVTSSGVVLTSLQTLNVLSGGTAISTFAAPEGGPAQINVFSGGYAIDTGVGASSVATISSGGTATGDFLNPAGTEILQGTAISTTAIFDATQDVSGLAIAATIDTGTQFVDAGGIAIGTTITGGFNGGTGEADGLEIVHSGGVTSNSILVSGYETIESGGTAIDTTATGLSEITVSAGGVVTGAVIDSGSVATVASGGTAWNTTIVSGGTMLNDGTTVSTTLFDGGTETVGDPLALYDPPAAPPAVASDTTVSGGTLLVAGGGTALGTVVDSGGTEYVGQDNYIYEPPLEPAVAVASDTTIDGGAVFLFGDGTLADGISFLGGSGFLYISGTFAVPTVVSGFGVTDRIEFAEMDYSSSATATWNSSTDVLTLSNGLEIPFTVQLAGDYAGAVFGVSSAGVYGGTVVTVLPMPCFAAGTRILTERGEIAVEHLAVGDRVATIEGRLKPITWIGHRRVDCRRHPEPEKVWPVRVAAHAFAWNAPCRDLLLSPDHAIFADGVLIPVKHLVNDVTVRQIAVPQITYFHVMLDQHAVILAEGLPAESYLDTGDSGSFAHAEGPTALHPAFGSERGDITLVAEALGYAPLRVTGAEVAAVKLLLAERIAEGSARRAG